MASKREPSPSLRMRKIALVICEGETEVCYINLLKSWYKSPIRIISHIEGQRSRHRWLRSVQRNSKSLNGIRCTHSSCTTWMCRPSMRNFTNARQKCCSAILALKYGCYFMPKTRRQQSKRMHSSKN